jgi:integral membrane protein
MWIISVLRIVGLLEGISFLVLLLIAMPLKYVANMPLPVSIVGGMHGFLFVAYVALAMLATVVFRWPVSKLLLALAASIIPTGTFWFDRSLQTLQTSNSRTE